LSSEENARVNFLLFLEISGSQTDKQTAPESHLFTFTPQLCIVYALTVQPSSMHVFMHRTRLNSCGVHNRTNHVAAIEQQNETDVR